MIIILNFIIEFPWFLVCAILFVYTGIKSSSLLMLDVVLFTESHPKPLNFPISTLPNPDGYSVV